MRERAESGIQSFVVSLVGQWESALEHQLDSPDIDRLLQMVREDGHYVPLNAITLNYLQKYKWERSLTDSEIVCNSLRSERLAG